MILGIQLTVTLFNLTIFIQIHDLYFIYLSLLHLLVVTSFTCLYFIELSNAFKRTPTHARPMIDAVNISSSSKASETAPDTEYGSSSGFSEYFKTIEVLSLARFT